MKILLLSRYDRLGASSRIRFFQYLDYLKQHNIDVTVAPLLNDAYVTALYNNQPKNTLAIVGAYWRRMLLLLGSHKYDLLWIEKELFPWLPPFAEQILDYFQIPYVVDYDDATFHSYDQHPQKIIRQLLGKKIDKIIRHAKVVVVGNEYLAQYAEQAKAKRVVVIPSVIDLQHYSLQPAPTNPVPVIGWIGTPATAKYLLSIAPALIEVCKQRRARLVAVGLTALELNDIPVEVRAWSEDTEVAEIQSFDIGIMPLFDEPWARGKCGYKLIQYMACAKPVIASPVGINNVLVQVDVNGLLASTTAEWVTALNKLLDNQQLRAEMGNAGRELVEKSYCVQVTAPRLLNLLSHARY